MVNLKQKRLDKGLTQEQVAEKLGITKGAYCDIENGKRGTKVYNIIKLSEILDFAWVEYYEEEPEDDARRA